MHFNKLRLTGFKSFVEAAELVIEPGLTGVVGPNGCGKSNLVEALRWVMGESSARQLRGEEMDDVIFAGTASRPARNLAEVVLHIDNAARRAPAAFNDYAEIEVSRRITRGEGSVYRINGREVRARDVQLLFADASSGARSAALVSQGQIGALIAARPEQRRAILEEAAGVSGLHARRHEAEQRLHAAESNLARVDDRLATLETQLQSLKKQARQANRYRRLGEQIRRAEATLFLARWQRAESALVEAQAALAAAEAEVDRTARAAASAAAELERAASALAPARRKEAEAAAALQRLDAERDALAAEARRAAEAERAARARAAELARDLERERARAADAAATVARLEQERDALLAAQVGEDEAREVAAERLAAAERETAALEAEAARAAEEFARAEAGRSALLRQLQEAEARTERLRRQREQLARDRAEAEAAGVSEAELAAAEEAAAAAEEQAAAAAEAVEAATDAIAEAREAEAVARDAAQRAETELTRLQTEERTLARLLAAETGEQAGAWPPVVDALEVAPGYEAALGGALGDELNAPTAADAPMHWRELEPLAPPPPLPAGAEPLIGHVAGAPALARRLSQVGLVADAATAESLRPQLLPGQRLVTPDGAMWRWDGFTVAAGATGAAAARLTHRNQLAALRARLPEAEAAAAVARRALEAARRAAQDAAGRERSLREAARQAQAAAAERRRAAASMSQRAAVQASRIAALADAAQRLGAELAAAEEQVAALRDGVAGAAEPAAARSRADRLRSTLAERRRQLMEARSLSDRQEREAAARARRLAAIEDEIPSWQSRAAEAAAHIDDLGARAAAAAAECEALAQAPDTFGARREELEARIEAAAERRRWAAADLAVAEAAAAERQAAAREAETALATAREGRVRAEAAVEHARATCATLADDIRRRFAREPDTLVELAAEDRRADDSEALEQWLARLQRERDGMGPVNLRADEEVETVSAEIAEVQAQREDLTAAIGKLRRGIAELNREARGRLLAAFEQVDRHFRELFVRLFGGGRAELALVGDEDPLAAGLDILASPPGKRLQSLSLLSGGERALAALSLLFAVFLTTPAPICVLDEVDAPLDDPNVDRFCTLLHEIAGTAATRFLVVTHHPLTMARMDRLFGVTMPERGVSQLVSVDLRIAEELRATA